MMTISEALKEICHYTICVDRDGKIHAIGAQPPPNVVERLERAGFGSGGDEWKAFVREMLHPSGEAQSVEDMLLAMMRGIVRDKRSRLARRCCDLVRRLLKIRTRLEVGYVLLALIPWRAWIVTVAVSSLYLSALTMDDQF